jgi:AcrR family transcriptional regulator
MPELVSENPVRRTQAERRSATQRALLDATVSSLVELGYRGTTTLEVERRAGVSRGARIHHFPNKAALLAAAGDQVYEELSSRYAEAFGATQRRRGELQRMRAGLRVLWGIYQQPQFTASLELNSAARTDVELRQALEGVAFRHRQLAMRAAAEFFPAIDRARAEMLIETIHAALVGLRVQHGATSEPRHAELVLQALEDLVGLHLQPRAPHKEKV